MANEKAGDKKVRPNDKVKFTWKGAKFHKDGSSSMLHPVQAEKMKKKGYGTYNEADVPKTGGKKMSQDVTAGGSDDNTGV